MLVHNWKQPFDVLLLICNLLIIKTSTCSVARVTSTTDQWCSTVKWSTTLTSSCERENSRAATHHRYKIFLWHFCWASFQVYSHQLTFTSDSDLNLTRIQLQNLVWMGLCNVIVFSPVWIKSVSSRMRISSTFNLVWIYLYDDSENYAHIEARYFFLQKGRSYKTIAQTIQN